MSHLVWRACARGMHVIQHLMVAVLFYTWGTSPCASLHATKHSNNRSSFAGWGCRCCMQAHKQTDSQWLMQVFVPAVMAKQQQTAAQVAVHVWPLSRCACFAGRSLKIHPVRSPVPCMEQDKALHACFKGLMSTVDAQGTHDIP